MLAEILTLIFGLFNLVGDPASRLLGVVCLFVSSHISHKQRLCLYVGAALRSRSWLMIS